MNVPKLRFPEFKQEWIRKKYGDVFSFRITNSYSRENLNYDDGFVKNIHYGDIHTKFNTLFDISKEVVPFINSEIKLKNISLDNYCKEGDLLIADASEDYEDVGKCIEILNINGEKVLSGLHTILARPDLYKMALGFNGYLMKSENIRLQIKTIAQGSKVLSISSKRLADLNLIVPQIPEQKKIAAFLTVVDYKLIQLKKKKTLLEQYKKGVMQKIFSQEIRFKNENGKEFPKWVKEKLGVVCDINTGNKNTQDRIEDGLYPFFVRSNTVEKINSFSYDGEAILTSGDGVGVGKNFHYVNGKFDFHQRVYCLCKFKKEYLGLYIYFVFSEQFYNRAIKLSAKNSVDSVRMDMISSMEIDFPSLPEQTKIANFLSAIDEKINYCSTQIEKTALWKKGLLQKMFV